ncbi:MAG: stage III sporulation protein AB [Lachnospiraceae bacterium]|nr:stage III sporulation protein AB [Lachnospiraceae bacterium]
MFKLFGACFLVVGGYFWGESIALKKKERYLNLLNWSQILMDIEGEIRTMATPLPILLVEIGEKRKCNIGESLIQVGKRIQMRERQSFAEIWEEEIKRGNFEMGKDELDRMISVGKNLGFLDKSQQVLFLEQTRKDLKMPIESAFLQWKEAKGFYEKIGILAASMIVVLLL